MDKYELKRLSDMLFAELLVGALIYKSSSELTVAMLQGSSVCKNYPEQYISQIVNDLISYGLVSPHISGTANISFSITDFGKYYYDKLSAENSDIGTMLIQVGGESR